jgi:hypothetical protein
MVAVAADRVERRERVGIGFNSGGDRIDDD